MQLLPRFEYVVPDNLSEAMAFLREYPQECLIMAGGTDVLVSMKGKKCSPRCVMDIKELLDLKGMRETKEGLELGALTTLYEIETSPAVINRWPALAEAAGTVGSYQVRTRATLGGNICNASPSADTAIPLIALQALANIAGPKGLRTIPLENVFKGPGENALDADELLISVSVPNPSARSGCVYLKHSPRKAMDIAIVGVAAYVHLDDRDTCKAARICLGAVAPIPLRTKNAEDILVGQELDEKLIALAASVASQEAKPISDVRSSADYRKAVLPVMIRRAIHDAVRRASERNRHEDL
jgi:carbon-monoxide dehydrogenase medium subunit